MLSLNRNHIIISNSSSTKEEAIKEVADLMVRSGFVKRDYVDGMFEREKQISTYLDNGIAIPHGTVEKRDSVLNTGIQVIFYPRGVDWHEGNRVRLVVGIAAKSDEHLDILRSLTHAVMDKGLSNKLDNVNTVDDLYDILTGGFTEKNDELKTISGGVSETFTLKNEHGLHARPCAELVKIAKKFDSTIEVSNLDGLHPEKVVSGKSMMKLVSLGVKSGHRLKFYADGSDADEALKAIGEGIMDGLGE